MESTERTGLGTVYDRTMRSLHGKTSLIRGWKKLLAGLSISQGSHQNRANGLCAMEVAALDHALDIARQAQEDAS